MEEIRKKYWSFISLTLLILVIIFLNVGCGSDVNDPEPSGSQPGAIDTPADIYFSLAITENSHNHTGARFLFLDFQDTTPDRSVIQNNVIISPKITQGAITLDGDASDWDQANLTTINSLVQNNYPLSEFIDAMPREITVGSAYDDTFIYFLLQWEDAGNTQSTTYKKWIFGDQGNNETGWNSKLHIGTTPGAPNENIVNRAHTLAGAESEDQILIMFPIIDSENNFSDGGLGCAAYCHANLNSDNPFQNYTGEGVAVMHTNQLDDIADIWHWKSIRTAPSGYADDKSLIYGTASDNGRKSDSGSSSYRSNPLVGGAPEYHHSSGLSYTGDILFLADAVPFNSVPSQGDQISSIISTQPNGSRGDIGSKEFYNPVTNRWTVEFRRLLDTGNNDDYQFLAGTDATPPASSAISAVDPGTGETLYINNCESCHGTNGIGSVAGNSWAFPRVQRASGSLVLKAIQTVVPMQGINLTDQDVEDIAAFLQTQATFKTTNSLTVTVSGTSTSSAVTSTPAGIDCPTTCTTEQTTGNSITLTANNVNGYVFSGWSGDCSGTNATCTVTLSADRVVTADYTTTPTNTLTVSVNGTTGLTGVVHSSPAGIDCPNTCSVDMDMDTAVTLTANTLSGYVFNGWSGACSGTNATCDITLSSDLSASVDYTVAVSNYTLTVNGSANGAVTDNNSPLNIDCGSDCTEIYADGSTVTLTATPAMNYKFDSWSGDVCNGSTSTTCQFAITANTTVAASFSPIITPGCQNGGVTFDTGGTNGYGLQKVINQGVVSNPTDIAFFPDGGGGFLVTAQSGWIYYFNGGCDPINSLDLRSTSGGIGVVNGGEQGLLNVEFHPDFSTNNYVFFYHTSVSSQTNSMSRMTLSFDVNGYMVLSDPVKIIDFRKPNRAGNHNGGGMVFAPDKTLLASVGDGGSGNSANSQINTNLLGAVIRINPVLTPGIGGYTIPGGNMFNPGYQQCSNVADSSASCPEILAMGLRNPYRMSINSAIVYLGDVGSSYEEINSFDYSAATINFGWPTYEGIVNQAGYADPLLAYRRNDATANLFRSEDPMSRYTGFASVIIGDTYNGSLYNGELTGRLFHAEFMDGFTRSLGIDSSGNRTDMGIHVIHHDGISAMVEGPDGYVYIATQGGAWGTTGPDMVYRLVKP